MAVSVLAASLSFQVPAAPGTVWVLVKRIRNNVNGAGMRLRMWQMQGFTPAQRPLLYREIPGCGGERTSLPVTGSWGPVRLGICGNARQDTAAQSQEDNATPLDLQFASNWSLPRGLHPEASGVKLAHGQGAFWDVDVGAVRER